MKLDCAESSQGEGGSVVAKTCQILRALSRAGAAGARLVDLSQSTGLSRPSIHRILADLKAEQFVAQSSARRYHLTALVHEIGLGAPGPADLTALLAPTLQALSDISGDTVYLAMRHGDTAYYLARCDGAVPTRRFGVQPFQALHLVSCHSGRALLAAMPEAESAEIIARAWAKDRSLFKATTKLSLTEDIEFIRENGYGWARDVTFEGVAGLTQPVPNPVGASYLAVTICASSPRLTFDRAQHLRPKLQATIHTIRSLIDDSKG